jgi:hypothetical protein
VKLLAAALGLASAIATSAASAAAWVDVTSNLPNNVQLVAALPGRGRVIALAGVQMNDTPSTLWTTSNGGTSWTPTGTGAGGEQVQLFFLGLLIDPVDSNSFWAWGNYDNHVIGGSYKTTDGGDTFHSFGYFPAICGQCEDEGLSVDFGDPLRKTMLIGTHEASKSVRKSVDGGNTFVNIGTTLPDGSARSEYPLIIDASTYLMGCSFTVSYGPSTAGGTPGVYRTTDGGAQWTQVATQSVFQDPLVTKDAIYWAFSNGASGGILKSTDKGLTWHAMPADGMDYTAQPIALPDGSIAAITSSHFVTVSADGGTSWTNVTPAIPLTSPLGLTYEPTGQALFAWKKSGGVQRMAYPVTAVGGGGGAAGTGSDAATPANDGATDDGGSGGAAEAGGAPRADAMGGGGGGAPGNVPGPDAAVGAGGTGAGGATAGVGGQGGATPVAHAASSGGCACATAVPTGLASRVPLSVPFPLSLFAGAAAFGRRRRR